MDTPGLAPVLQCARCGAEFLGEPDKDYSAGVLCPTERAKKPRPRIVGVCHPTGEMLPVDTPMADVWY